MPDYTVEDEILDEAVPSADCCAAIVELDDPGMPSDDVALSGEAPAVIYTHDKLSDEEVG